MPTTKQTPSNWLGFNLNRNCYDVLSDPDGAAALTRASRHAGSIVLDVMMPGVDATEVCRRLVTR